MAEEKRFKADDQTLESIFEAPSRYRVPRYQRPYSWGDDNVNEFWEDVVESGTPSFIGSFVLNLESLDEEGFIDIIDGQQRLLTTTIFFAALRDAAVTVDVAMAKRIQTKRIAFEDKHGRQSYRLTCGDSTREFFEECIQKESGDPINSKPKTAEHKRVRQNYLIFKESIARNLATGLSLEVKQKLLHKLWDAVDHANIICIKIYSEDDAFEIFETVNARGVDLTVADLLKNLIFKRLKGAADIDAVRESWASIERNILSTSSEISKFVRYYWLSSKQFLPERKLYKDIKRTIRDYDALLDSLLSASNAWKALLLGDENDLKEFVRKDAVPIARSLEGLRAMRVTQCYVIFLAVLRNAEFTKKEAARIFELIEKFSFNYSYIGKQPANKIEKLYSKFALDLEELALARGDKSAALSKLVDSLAKDLGELRITKEEFIARFQNIEYGTNEIDRRIIKYILSRINDCFITGEMKIDFANVSIEHLLPQKPDKAWGLKKGEIKPYVDKLGNLTLVSRRINEEIGNGPIVNKLVELEKSEIEITRQLVNEVRDGGNVWNEEKIGKRHANLAHLAYDKIWAL